MFKKTNKNEQRREGFWLTVLRDMVPEAFYGLCWGCSYASSQNNHVEERNLAVQCGKREWHSESRFLVLEC